MNPQKTPGPDRKSSPQAARIDTLVRDAVFGADEARKRSREEIRKLAAAKDILPSSIDGLYEASGKGLYSNATVPAINIRGITYNAARAVFRAAIKDKVGPFIFEIARSEIGYTQQKPDEYAVCVLAAALREGYSGPVFLQGDHFQVSRSKYLVEPQKEEAAIRDLIREAVAAGFLNIDIDASTVVDIDKPDLEAQQEANCRVTADMTKFIREIQPAGKNISVGGEIGEVGGRNSTVADLQAFMAGYTTMRGPGLRGLSKISIQTGTTHGGVVLPDGSLASIDIDFKVLKELSRAARNVYGMGGAVQHGASTLPDHAFELFPQAETLEVHLATGFQNIIMDSPAFPAALTQAINSALRVKYAGEKKSSDTDEQFIYKTRKKAFGDFKREMWDLPEAALAEIGRELEERFSLLFHKLKVTGTTDLVTRFIK